MQKNGKWIMLFSLAVVLLLTAMAVPEEASRTSGGLLRAVVVYAPGADADAMASVLEETEGAALLCRYDALFAGAAVEADAGTLEALRDLPGVAEVDLARSYDCAAAPGGGSPLSAREGLKLMGADGLWEQGWTGDGMVIAVLDSGLNTGHEVFADDSLMNAPALSREDVAEFSARGGTKGRYVSPRIPFVYDYYSRDDDVSTANGHGTHVAALAAGYGEDASFRGAAPAAQILGMKIFPDDSGGGTDDTIILRALEDAWNLGANVVNLSVGTGAGFSGSDALGGVYCRAFEQMARSGVIICCAAGNSAPSVQTKSWGQPLPAGGYTDYGSLCSPGSFTGALAVAAASQAEDGGMTMADYSSRGPASGLHLAPALTAFGGPVLSAGVAADDRYRSDRGTSMASAYAAGSFAVLLQAVGEQGVTDKAEAAALVRSLLASHARVLEGEDGVPLSPRRQGAGLIDLQGAASGALTVAEPLIELGESAEGRFTLPVTLRNLSGEAVSVTLDVQVLTDACEERGGRWYSLMTPRDITGDVTVDGARTITVPARGEASAALTLTVSEQLRRELAEVCPNGFYVEGYVTASGGGETAHGAFLGYCGDWESAPVLEPLDFRDVQDAAFRLAGEGELSTERRALPGDLQDCLEALGANLGANLAFLAEESGAQPENGALLGFNGHARGVHDDRRNALSVWEGNTSAGTLCLDLYTLRDAAAVVMVVSDQDTGKIYRVEEELLLEKSGTSLLSPDVVPSAGFSWDGTDAEGGKLPAGTRVRVDVYAWLDTHEEVQAAYRKNVSRSSPESYGWLLEDAYVGYRALSFPVTLDGAPPAVSAALSGSALTLTVEDDQFAAYAAVLDAGGNLLTESAFQPEEAGTACTLTVDLSGGALPEKLYIQAEDYAANIVGWEVDVTSLASGEAAAPKMCAAVLLRDVDYDAWYHEAVDRVVGAGVMRTRLDGFFLPQEDAARWDIVDALYRAGGSPAPGLSLDELPFHDVPRWAKYGEALCWAYEEGLVSGRPDGAFYGTAGVTRQELAVMLYRWAKPEGGSGGDLSAFPDGESAGDWAREALSWAVETGLLRGDAAGRLNPNDSVTRAEAAQMLARFMELS